MKHVARLVAVAALATAMGCVVQPGTIEEPAPQVETVPLRARYTVNCGTRSPAGYGAGFHDPRNGGECWACPNSNPVRTWSAINAADACATQSVAGLGARTARAKFLGPYGACPRGDVQQGGRCLYCPTGSTWSPQQSACVK